MGCAYGKMVNPDDKKITSYEDYKTCYASIEPLSEEAEEFYNRFNTVTRIIQDLGLSNAYNMPSFWCRNGEYKVIPTKYHKGYMQALDDVEKEIRMQFGFSERDDVLNMQISLQGQMEGVQ